MSNPRDPGQPHLQHALSALRLPARARTVCEQLGIETIGQFLAVPREQFLALPGCGERTFSDLERRVFEWLAHSLADRDHLRSGDRSIVPLLHSLAAERAMQALGIRTVAEFEATPKERVLAQPGVGPRTYRRIQDAIERTRPTPGAGTHLLPPSLRGLDLRRLALPVPVVQQLDELGCTTVGNVLALPNHLFAEGGELGPATADAVRTTLEQLFRAALEQIDTRPVDEEMDWPQLRERLLHPLREHERVHFCRRVGIEQPPHTMDEVAAADGIPRRELRRLEQAIRQRLAQRAPSLLCRLRYEAARELEAFEGILRADRFAARSLLSSAAKGSGDRALPLRLVAFCFPTEFHDHGGFLSGLSKRVAIRFQRALRRATSHERLPRALGEIEADLQQVVDPVPRGLMQHVLCDVLSLRVHIDNARGELVLPPVPLIVQRMADLLHEEGQPMAIEELVFCYRERFRKARRHHLEGHLRRDPVFLMVDRDTWSLRSRHTEELAKASMHAEAASEQILERGGRHHVLDLVPQLERQQVWLVLDQLRRDPRLRYLGRGDFCPAAHNRSRALAQLLKDFRRAGGEVVFGRFLDNQPADRRRLVERLLRENRSFVFPDEDRIDLLSNYPFNEERLGRLNALVTEFLQLRNGYGPLEEVLEAVNATELGGGWLTPVLLGEVLRRNGPFEVLPGVVALRTLGLGGWLLRRARNALREAGVPITVDEILAERPELTEFGPSIAELLLQDPLVQTPDGARFQIT